MLWSTEEPSNTPNTPAAADPIDDGIALRVRIHQRLLELLNLIVLDRTPRETLQAEIRGVVSQLLAEEKRFLTAAQTDRLLQDILDELLGLGPLEPLLKDETITDIMEKTCGARLTMNYMVPGGVMAELHPDFQKDVKSFIELYKKKIHENIPKILETPIHKNEDCFLKNYVLAKLSSKRTFCGGTGTGTGVCNGDSGSGIIITDGNVFYLRGIVSSSLIGGLYGCDVDNYSVFTDVTKYINWINGIPTSRFQ